VLYALTVHKLVDFLGSFDCVLAFATVDVVYLFVNMPLVDGVVAALAVDDVVACRARYLVIPGGPIDGIVAEIPIEGIVSFVARQPVITRPPLRVSSPSVPSSTFGAFSTFLSFWLFTTAAFCYTLAISAAATTTADESTARMVTVALPPGGLLLEGESTALAPRKKTPPTIASNTPLTIIMKAGAAMKFKLQPQ
jgi:hypothetical protein